MNQTCPVMTSITFTCLFVFTTNFRSQSPIMQLAGGVLVPTSLRPRGACGVIVADDDGAVPLDDEGQDSPLILPRGLC